MALKNHESVFQQQHDELRMLNRTSKELAASQGRVASMTAELAELIAAQAALQAETLDLQRQQVVLQEQQLNAQRMASIQLQLQTEIMQVNELRQRRQREMKSTLFELRTQLNEFPGGLPALRRAAALALIDLGAKSAGLSPSTFEELGDKEAAEVVLARLDGMRQESLDNLDRDRLRALTEFLAGPPAAARMAYAAAQQGVADAAAALDALEMEAIPAPPKKPSEIRPILLGSLAWLLGIMVMIVVGLAGVVDGGSDFHFALVVFAPMAFAWLVARWVRKKDLARFEREPVGLRDSEPKLAAARTALAHAKEAERQTALGSRQESAAWRDFLERSALEDLAGLLPDPE